MDDAAHLSEGGGGDVAEPCGVLTGIVLPAGIEEPLDQLRFDGKELQVLSLDVVQISCESLPLVRDGAFGLDRTQVIDFKSERVNRVLPDDRKCQQGPDRDRQDYYLGFPGSGEHECTEDARDRGQDYAQRTRPERARGNRAESESDGQCRGGNGSGNTGRHRCEHSRSGNEHDAPCGGHRWATPESRQRPIAGRLGEQRRTTEHTDQCGDEDSGDRSPEVFPGREGDGGCEQCSDDERDMR
ncbi:hypothetical protein GCM10022261_00450 [Brevibacterium daeguense]|uniref:Uncharacterized protein n=1 Tax=Brevibacterium daeguense TaxID=909936 RepID=A0ABP8EF27_9MICO